MKKLLYVIAVWVLQAQFITAQTVQKHANTLNFLVLGAIICSILYYKLPSLRG